MPGGTRVRFHGVRGSTPCAGARYERYGGNTSCVSLEVDGHAPVIFDMGTGLRPYGEQIVGFPTSGPEGKVAPFGAFHGTALLTHLHWDHIQGLPFFAPLGNPDATLEVVGPRQEEGPLADVFAGVMRPPYFPIYPHQLTGTVSFHDAGNDDFAVNGAKVRSRWVRHTSPTLGFRVEVEGVSVAYLSDHGPGCSDDPADFVPPDVLELCDGADLVIHDSQHTNEEYEDKWFYGHCTADYAVHVAREAGARRLMLFHHCPTHCDDDVDLMLVHAQELGAAGGVDVLAATEGLCVELHHALAR
ncbi:MAG TPA: MBL fold metallo-hydrolase [Acidimicrobiia bacterium]|nr:MBL fold metallo-hydrolase [Acidimicrobiia bacterium]